MEVNEDEPEDVRKATPVAGAIKSGAKDEKAGDPKATGKKKDVAKSSRCDKKAKKPVPAKSEADCCRGKISKARSKGPETMSVLVYSPPCTLPRLEIIPRHCLSKQEYIDVLASPSRKCPPPCLGRTVVRKVRPISARMNELAQPGRRLIVSTLQERGATLPPEMIENLVKTIEGSACMTPEQAERYFRDKERGNEKKGRKTMRQKCGGVSKKGQCPSQLDKEAVMCQYLMAERFVRSIIQWKCPIPVEEFADISSVILRRLSFVLEYQPIDGQDLKSQQMRFLADIIACWISGVLFEVAEEHKKEIEEEIKTQAETEAEEEEEDEDEDEDDRKEEPKSQEPEEDEEEVEKLSGQDQTKGKEKEVLEEKREKVKTQETGTQTEELAKDPKAQETPVVVKPEPLDPQEVREKENAKIEADKKKLQAEIEERTRKEAEEKARLEAEKQKKALENEKRMEEEKRKKKAEEEEELRKKEAEEKKLRDQKKAEEEEARIKQQKREEEEAAKKLKEAENRKKREIEAEENQKKESEMKKKKSEDTRLKQLGPKDAIAKIGEDDLFATDIPFVSFGKIIDTVYKMLEEEPEGDETDLMHNRIQRGLYEKIIGLIVLEKPDTLSENLKDIVDVLSGKIATWIARLLNDSELKFMQLHPPEVQSREIRDWGKWIDQVTDRAGDWANWIHRVVKEAEDHRDKSANINRGDWQNWTSDTETKALLWRRYYLETVHQAHHNKMMLVDRTVVKTGEKRFYTTVEEEINNTDLGNDDNQ